MEVITPRAHQVDRPVVGEEIGPVDVADVAPVVPGGPFVRGVQDLHGVVQAAQAVARPEEIMREEPPTRPWQLEDAGRARENLQALRADPHHLGQVCEQGRARQLAPATAVADAQRRLPPPAAAQA